MRRILLPLFVCLPGVPMSMAQDLEQILEAHYKAAALDKMEEVRTMVTTGTNVYTMAGIESGFTIYQSRPDLIRIEGEFQGSEVIQTYGGDTGWIYAPKMGIAEPRRMEGEELEMLLTQAEFESPLWKYREKGHAVELMGTNATGDAHHIRLTTKDGNVRHFHIDTDTHLVNAVETSQMMGGSDTGITVNLDDYREVRGIPVAFRIVTKMNGQVVTTIRIEQVEFNRPLEESLFEKPDIE